MNGSGADLTAIADDGDPGDGAGPPAAPAAAPPHGPGADGHDGGDGGDGTSAPRPFGSPGRPLNRRTPFFVGMTAAAGVAVTYLAFELVVSARDVLVLIGLALFLAIGLEPAVGWLTARRLPRWLAVIIVLVVLFGVVTLFIVLAVTPLVQQTEQLIDRLPGYVHSLQNHDSVLGRLNDRFHLEQRASQLTSGSAASSILGGVVGAGRVVLDAATSFVTVMVLTVYFLFDLPRIRRSIYRMFPASRRDRAVLIGDEIFAKIGGYLLGNLITSVVAGLGTLVWLIAFGVPYALLLSLFVALVDLVPVVGSTIGGIVVSLVALVVSLPVAIATACFYVGYRFAEDYLLTPKVIGRTVDVPGVATIVAVLVGGALLGIVGALVAIPVAAAGRLLLRELAYPRLDRS